MTLDEATGVWSVTGEADWDRQYYLFEVEVYVPVDRVGRAQPRDRSVFAQPVDQLARAARSSTWRRRPQADGLGRVGKPASATPEEIVLYELHVRDFSINDETVPERAARHLPGVHRRGSDGMKHLRRWPRPA